MSKRENPSNPSSAASRDLADGLAHAESAISRVVAHTEHTERLATLGIMAASIAHEMRNILTPILAYAQLALAHPDDEDLQGKAIEKAVNGIEVASRIADAVLGFAGESDATESDVHDVVKATLSCMAYDPNKDRISIDVDVQSGTSARMNPLCLQQVLTNLLLNARDAIGQRPGRVTINAITRADGTVGIRVTDTGPGIPREIAGRIFEPFVTNKRNSRHQSGSGTGLGLAVCRRLIEQASGTITAMSKPGNGTTFVITLPSAQHRRAKAG
jgi:signal transduction histidine kinase